MTMMVHINAMILKWLQKVTKKGFGFKNTHNDNNSSLLNS
jgi:hypothetical protein